MAKNDNSAFFKAFKGDVRKYAQTFCESFTRKAADNITQFAFESLLDDYYSQYNPYDYKRTYDMLTKSYKDYYETVGDEWRGGIELTSEDLNYGYPKKAGLTDEQIIVGVWHLGYHGRMVYVKDGPGNSVVKFSKIIETYPKVFIDVEMKAHDSKHIKEVKRYAEEQAKKQKYSVINFE